MRKETDTQEGVGIRLGGGMTRIGEPIGGPLSRGAGIRVGYAVWCLNCFGNIATIRNITFLNFATFLAATSGGQNNQFDPKTDSLSKIYFFRNFECGF